MHKMNYERVFSWDTNLIYDAIWWDINLIYEDTSF